MKIEKAKELAMMLMRENKLTEWKLHFDNARNRFGKCSHTLKQINLSTILVKLNDEQKVKETILHEIAHATIGPGNGHNRKWKTAAVSIGCNAERCFADEVITPRATFTGTCPTCKREIQRHARRASLSCGGCCKGRYNPEHKFVWTRN